MPKKKTYAIIKKKEKKYISTENKASIRWGLHLH